MIPRFIFENSLFGPFLSAILSGYAAVGWWDGKVYLTKAGEEYLATLGD